MKAFAKALAKARPLTYCDALVTRNDTPPTHISLDYAARRLRAVAASIPRRIKSPPTSNVPKLNGKRNAMPIIRTSLCLTVVLSGTGVGYASLDSDIAIKDIGHNQYELTLHTTTTINVFEAQRELAPTAKRTCADKEAHFGHYAFAIDEPSPGHSGKTTNLTLTQTIRCGSETPSPIPQSSSAPDGWKPTALDQSQIESQTYGYYSAKDAGDYAAAYAMFDNGMKQATHFDTWSANARSQYAKAGHVLNRLVLKITWYKDPPSAPEPGIYAAADFSGQFESDPIYCGYVAWHRGADGKFRVIREQENFIDKGSIAKMSQIEVKALATKLGCATAQ
jgi:hypothetical protein